LVHFPLARTATHDFFKCPGMEGWQSGRLRLIRKETLTSVRGLKAPLIEGSDSFGMTYKYSEVLFLG